MELRLAQDDVDAIARRVVVLLQEDATPAPPPDRWLTTAEAAEHLGLSLHALRHLVARRAIPFSQERPNARQFFRASELDRWRAQQTREPLT